MTKRARKTYWMTCAQQAATEPIEENGGGPKFVATPLVAVMEEKKEKEREKEKKTPSPPAPTKNGIAKLKPTPHPRHNYYDIKVEMPETAESLAHQCDDGLVEEINPEEEKAVLVRLVNGKRVKDVITTPKKQETESPAPPDYPPPPIPTLVLDEVKEEKNEAQAETNLELQGGQGTPKIEAITVVKEEPLIISTKCIKIESSLQSPEMAKQEENVEIITSQHSAVVSIASVEHTVSTTTEYVANGVSCTTTKETHSLQQTNGSTAVH